MDLAGAATIACCKIERMRAAAIVLKAVFSLVVPGLASAQAPKSAPPTIGLSCTMESPAEYRNHVVAIGIHEPSGSATVQGRAAREVQIEYLRFVLVEEKVRWVVDRGTGRVSMFTTTGETPVLYGNGVCERITKRKF